MTRQSHRFSYFFFSKWKCGTFVIAFGLPVGITHDDFYYFLSSMFKCLSLTCSSGCFLKDFYPAPFYLQKAIHEHWHSQSQRECLRRCVRVCVCILIYLYNVIFNGYIFLHFIAYDMPYFEFYLKFESHSFL